jgi:hypothetical protein
LRRLKRRALHGIRFAFSFPAVAKVWTRRETPMRRPIGIIAAASMFLLSSLAGAQEPKVLTMKAELKADHSTGKELSFVYISGDALYPDGTKLFVGVQHPGGFKYLMTVSCFVEKGHFLAEIGPWEQHFPAGRYRVVGEFRFEDQNPAMQEKLGDFRDMKRCLKDNAEFAAEYQRENPVRYKLLKDYIDRTGRCPGKTGTGDTQLVVGSDEDADRARETEKQALKGYAESAARLSATLASVPAEADTAATLAAWRTEWTTLDGDLRHQNTSVVCCSWPEAAAAVDSAYLTLDWLAGDVEALSVKGGALRKDIATLTANGDPTDRDDRRRLARLKSELAALESACTTHARAVAQSISEALFGPKGLDPAPERARLKVHELLEPFGAEPPAK